MKTSRAVFWIIAEVMLGILIGTIVTLFFSSHCDWEDCPKNWDCEEDTDCGLIQQIHMEHPTWSGSRVEDELHGAWNYYKLKLTDSTIHLVDNQDGRVVADLSKDSLLWGIIVQDNR